MTMQTIKHPSRWLATACVLALTPTLAMADGRGDYAREQGWDSPVPDMQTGMLLFDRLEYAAGDDEDSVDWEFKGWYGGDTNRLVIKGEGEHVVSGGDGGEIEALDLLYGRLIAPYWSVQAGVGYQLEYGPGPNHDRGFAVVGLEGLAPYWFEIDTNLRVSGDGDASVDFEAEYDFLLTQRLILQPRFGTSVAFQEVEEFGVGQGVNHVKAGLRLRYEVQREFAPYIGVGWKKQLGDTADLAREEGHDTEDLRLVAGVRMWF